MKDTLFTLYAITMLLAFVGFGQAVKRHWVRGYRLTLVGSAIGLTAVVGSYFTMLQAGTGRSVPILAIVINSVMIAIATGVAIASGHRQQSLSEIWSGMVNDHPIRLLTGQPPSAKGVGEWIIPTRTRLTEWTALAGPFQQLLDKDIRLHLEQKRDVKVGQVVETKGSGLGSEKIAWVPVQSPKQQAKITDLTGAYRAGIRISRKHNLTPGLIIGPISGLKNDDIAECVFNLLLSDDGDYPYVVLSPEQPMLKALQKRLENAKNT